MQYQLKASVLLATLALEGCDYFEVQAQVECSSIEGGISCVIERKEGLRQAEACWSVAFVCRNGIKMQHGMCSNVHPTPGEKVSKIAAWQEIANYKECDKISAMSAENLILK